MLTYSASFFRAGTELIAEAGAELTKLPRPESETTDDGKRGALQDVRLLGCELQRRQSP